MRVLVVSMLGLLGVSGVVSAAPPKADTSDEPIVAVPAQDGPKLADDEASQAPVLQHMKSAGATLRDLGRAHGVRTILAQHGAEFMILEVPEDGQVAVAGLEADLTVAQLLALAGDRATDLGVAHGMRVLFVRNGDQFQVFYGTPDGERVVPGVMWGASGNNLTREQVAGIEGTIPTVVIGPEGASGIAVASPGSRPASLESRLASHPSALVKQTHYGTYGRAGAPRLWVFVDPLCSFSIKAMAALDSYVARGGVELAVIPLSVLDYEDGGRSTPSALGMLSKPSAEMVPAWRNRSLDVPPTPDAAASLRANMAIAEAIGLKGTPTLVWTRADGTEGRVDGVPGDIEAVISSLGRAAP
jgi:thiol:disulfide interchange protein DsbG